MLDISAQGGKWVELLKEIAPRTQRISLLSNPETGPPLQFFVGSRGDISVHLIYVSYSIESGLVSMIGMAHFPTVGSIA
jgi:hypothetical protein